MLNVYSCGCTALDVPVVSQCDEHGGHVVVATEDYVPYEKRKAFMTKDKSTVLFYANATDGMQKLSDGTVGLVFSYPDHFHFYARTFVCGRAFRDFPDKYFTECDRILNDCGKVVLLVEHTILGSVVYCAALAGFKLADYHLIPMQISDHPIQHDFVNRYNTYKAGLVFTREGKSLGKRCTTLKEFEKAALSLHDDGHIVDTSCIHYPFIIRARKKARTIGVVSNPHRYASLKKRLVKVSK